MPVLHQTRPPADSRRSSHGRQGEPACDYPPESNPVSLLAADPSLRATFGRPSQCAPTALEGIATHDAGGIFGENQSPICIDKTVFCATGTPIFWTTTRMSRVCSSAPRPSRGRSMRSRYMWLKTHQGVLCLLASSVCRSTVSSWIFPQILRCPLGDADRRFLVQRK